MIQALSGPPRFVLASEVDSVKAAAQHQTQQAEEGKEAFRSEYPVKALQFDYKFKRDKKPFAISEIYHDDKFTYIRSSAQEKPTLYEVKDGAPNLINFDLHDGVYIAPKVQDVFRSFNRGKLRKHNFAFTGLLNCAYDNCSVTAEIKKQRYTYYPLHRVPRKM